MLCSVFIPLPAISRSKAFYFQAVRATMRLLSYTESLWTRYLTKRLSEFHQIFNLDVVGDRDDLIRFWD